jgi:hypothetical protein
MKQFLALILLGAGLAGCGSGGDVSTNDVRSKEQQIEEASKKLNSGQTAPQSQDQ